VFWCSSNTQLLKSFTCQHGNADAHDALYSADNVVSAFRLAQLVLVGDVAVVGELELVDGFDDV
jgi:hypothetical protein